MGRRRLMRAWEAAEAAEADAAVAPVRRRARAAAGHAGATRRARVRAGGPVLKQVGSPQSAVRRLDSGRPAPAARAVQALPAAARLGARPDPDLGGARHGLAVPAASRARRGDPPERHPAPRGAGRRDDRDRDRHGRARRRADAALEHRRPAGHARPACRGLPPSSAAVPGVLHADPHGRGAVADRQRHRRRADGRDEHRDLDRLERDHGAGRDGRDVPARLAPRAWRRSDCCRSSYGSPAAWARNGGGSRPCARTGSPTCRRWSRSRCRSRGSCSARRWAARRSLRSGSRASLPRSRTSRSAPAWRGAGAWRRCR